MLKNLIVKINNYFNNLYIVKKCSFGFKKRNAIYYQIAKLTSHDLSFIKTIEEIRSYEISGDYGNLKTPIYFVLKDIYRRQQSGSDIAHAFGNYISDNDRMMIAAFEGEDISRGFDDLVAYNNTTSEMQRAFVIALAYPLFLILLFFGVMSYFSLSLIPQIAGAITPDTTLSVTSSIMLWIANNYWLWFPCVAGFLVCGIIFLMWALPNMNNYLRLKLEEVPPFSMYRVKIGCSFLSALNSLTRSGAQQVEAIYKMERDAKPYLKARLSVILQHMRDGKNLGQALIDSKLNFPDKDLVKPLSSLAKYGLLEDSLDKLTQDLNRDGLSQVKTQATFLKFLITCLLASGILFSFISIYAITQDIATSIEQKH